MSDPRDLPTYNPLSLDAFSDPTPDFTDGREYMDNPPAAGAPKNSRWGYLPCGCCNDGYGRHIYS